MRGPLSRARFLAKWDQLEKADGLSKTRYDHEFDHLESKGFDYLSTIVDSLRIAVGDVKDSHEAYELAKLEILLRKTPVLLHRRGVVPKGEMDVQRIMHDYLEACFTEYSHPVTITGTMKNFKPDGGVRNLKAGIEFKFADSKEELAKGLGGVFEDGGGYSGSLDWTRFYSVIYQTDAFESEDRFRTEFARAGMVTWKAILVTGKGFRS